MSNGEGRRASRVDRAKEQIFWANSFWDARRKPLFWVDMAGRTFRDKNYFISRSGPRFAGGDLFVLEYVTSGSGYLEALGEKTRVGAGDLYVINCRIPHCYYADPHDPFEKKWINVRGGFLGAVEPLLLGGKPYAVFPIGEEAGRVMDDIHKRIRRATPADSEQMISDVMKQIVDLLGLCDRCRREEMEKLSPEEQIARYVEENICLDLRVSDLCEHFFTSPSTLYRRITSAFGITPKDLILQKKIEAAKHMIAANESDLSAIASVLHFSDHHHLFRCFRRYTGMSPSEYRASVNEGSLQ